MNSAVFLKTISQDSGPEKTEESTIETQPSASQWSEFITRDNPSHAHRASSLELIEPGRVIPLHFLYSVQEPGASIFISGAIISPVLCRESGGYRLRRPWHSHKDYCCISALLYIHWGPLLSWHLLSITQSVSRTQLSLNHCNKQALSTSSRYLKTWMDKIDSFQMSVTRGVSWVFGGDSSDQEKYDTAQSGCLAVKAAHCFTCTCTE